MSSGVRLPHELSSKTFVCGVAKPQRRIRTCPSKEKATELVKFLEGAHSGPSISHHKKSLACKDFGLIEMGITSRSLLANPGKSLVPRLTLKDVVDAKSACICRDEKIIGKRDLRHRENMLEDNDVSIKSRISEPFSVEEQWRACSLNLNPPTISNEVRNHM